MASAASPTISRPRAWVTFSFCVRRTPVRIRGVDARAALAAPGVLAAFPGAELASAGVKPTAAGNAATIGQAPAQQRKMRFAPVRDGVEIVAIGHRAADQKQQNLRQRMSHPPRLPRVLDDGKMVQQGPKARFVAELGRSETHGRLPNQSATKESHSTQSVKPR